MGFLLREKSGCDTIKNEVEKLDKDLLILKEFSDAQLQYLFDIMKKQAFITCSLKDDIKQDIHAHVEEVADELCRFGGNTFANVYRGKGVSYLEILQDIFTCHKLRFETCDDAKTLEEKLLKAFFVKSWNEMDTKTKKEILEGIKRSALWGDAKDKVVKSGGVGFVSTLFLGPLGNTILLGTVVKMVTGPAMRVLLPCVLFVAGTRQSLGGNKS